MQSTSTIAARSGTIHSKPRASRGAGSDELFLVAALSALLSLFAFAFFYRRGDILLYGDAVAHLNIARRILDSRDPGWDQLGTVWLPLPHLLAAPFLVNDRLWRSGAGGSIPSMVAYVLGVTGVFRLVRARASRAGAWLAAAIYALNPSLLYMQSTAMTESIFLAALIWSVVYFDEFLHGLGDASSARNLAAPMPASSIPPWRALERCGLCLAAAIFTRYDGWIFAFLVGLCAVAAVLNWLGGPHLPAVGECGDAGSGTGGPHLPAVGKCGEAARRARLLRSTASFLLLLALCPCFWLAHNYKINRRPLDWLNGPYSAKAIERRSTRPGDAPYPGKDHPIVAAQYFLKAARMNTGEGGRETWLLTLAAAGAPIALLHLRRFGALFLLWIPLPFYAYSIAYGSVPIFVPEWWPFSYYNVRYGLELLPAIAVFAGLILWGLAQLPKLPGMASRISIAPTQRRWLTVTATAVLFAVAVLACNSSAWCFSRRSQDRNWGRRWMIPICYREAWANSRDRLPMEAQLAGVLSDLPPNSTVLMYTSDHVGALQGAGIHFDHVVSESSFITWDAALSAPFAAADYVVAVAGDPVAEAVRVNPRGLTKLAILRTQGKPDVTVYRGSRP